jgi:hypothetical protein
MPRLFGGFVNGLLCLVFHLVTCFLNGLLGRSPCISGSGLDGSSRIFHILLRALLILRYAYGAGNEYKHHRSRESALSQIHKIVFYRFYRETFLFDFTAKQREPKLGPAHFPQLVWSDIRYRMSVPVA